jgi:hypothetical protein
VGAVEFERQRGELLKREVMVGLLPRLAELALGRVPVTLGEVVQNVSLFVLHAALDRDLVPEHLTDRLAERFGAVDHEQQPLFDIQATVDQVGQQR